MFIIDDFCVYSYVIRIARRYISPLKASLFSKLWILRPGSSRTMGRPGRSGWGRGDVTSARCSAARRTADDAATFDVIERGFVYCVVLRVVTLRSCAVAFCMVQRTLVCNYGVIYDCWLLIIVSKIVHIYFLKLEYAMWFWPAALMKTKTINFLFVKSQINVNGKWSVFCYKRGSAATD